MYPRSTKNRGSSANSKLTRYFGFFLGTVFVFFLGTRYATVNNETARTSNIYQKAPVPTTPISTNLRQAVEAETKVPKKTSNEKYYDEAYQKWQLTSNKFGALYKKRYWRDYVKPHYKCVEFGCSSGYILKSMECGELMGVEINDAARSHAQNVLGLNVVYRTSEIPDASQDLVFSTSVLEHVECPVCEIRELHRILKPGGVLTITTPGQAPRSSEFKRNDVNFEFQMFGGLELGNILTAAGFEIRNPENCFSEVTQWPPNAEEVFNRLGGLDPFIEYAKEYGKTHDKLVTTWCVGYKKMV